jgi:hypothetical protein
MRAVHAVLMILGLHVSSGKGVGGKDSHAAVRHNHAAYSRVSTPDVCLKIWLN